MAPFLLQALFSVNRDIDRVGEIKQYKYMELQKHLSSPHNLLLLLATFFIALVIPVSVFLAQNPQDIRQRAQTSSDTYSVKGYVCLDTNKNGVSDPGESGASDVVVYFVDANVARPIKSARTGAEGNYFASDLPSGTYNVFPFPYYGSSEYVYYKGYCARPLNRMVDVSQDVSGVDFCMSFCENPTSSPITPTEKTVQLTTPPVSAVDQSGFCGIGENDLAKFASKLFGCGISLVGGVGLLFIIYGGFILVTSSGDPHRINVGKQYITYAIVGIVLAILTVIILEVIGANILQIPGIS